MRVTVKNLLEARKQSERPKNEALIEAKKHLFWSLMRVRGTLTNREEKILDLLTNDPEVE